MDFLLLLLVRVPQILSFLRALAALVAEQLGVLGLGDVEGAPVADARMILDVLLEMCKSSA